MEQMKPTETLYACLNNCFGPTAQAMLTENAGRRLY